MTVEKPLARLVKLAQYIERVKGFVLRVTEAVPGWSEGDEPLLRIDGRHSQMLIRPLITPIAVDEYLLSFTSGRLCRLGR